MKKITIYSLFIFSGISAFAQDARVQVIHNSADAAASTVDVYVDGTLLADNLDFRTATPFVNAPAGVPVSIVVAPGNSTSAAEGFYTTTATFTENSTNIAIASGIISQTGYTPNQPFTLFMYNMARETSIMQDDTDILVFHGSTDAPTVDAVQPGIGVAVNDISYGQFQGYLEMDNQDIMLNVTTSDNNTVIQGYSLPLDLLGLDGEAVTILASGFFTPANNSAGPGFGLWLALPEGGDLIQLPHSNDEARVQIIHNSADLAASTIDVYVNDDLYLDNFAFRTATPFMDVAAGLPITIKVAPGNSTSAADSVFSKTITFQDEETYILVASGIVSTTGYTPTQPFNLHIFPTGRETSAVGANTDLLLFHGGTDTPVIDIVQQGEGILFNNLAYSEFAGYVSFPATEDYSINVTTEDGSSVIQTYDIPLQTMNWAGQAITIVASGFMMPQNNSNGPAFGLWAAMPAGGNLVQLPLGELGVAGSDMQNVSIYPNPSRSFVTIAVPDGFSSIETVLYDMSGRKVLSSKGNTTIDVAGLNTGVYVMDLVIDGKLKRQKLVKE